MTHDPYPSPGPSDPFGQQRPDTPFEQPHPGGAPYPSGAQPHPGEVSPYGGTPQTGGWQGPSEVSGADNVPLTTIGDITVTRTEVITPSGRFPIKGSMWNVNDMTQQHETIPPVAIVLAILFFVFCLLGLLFLLMKERRITGSIQVTVQGHGIVHSTLIPARDPSTMMQVVQHVNYARSLAAMP
ncbi:hypothetical protein CDO52_09750 [Nocardiopsis gilva YIM 90087]|uniref:Uncharacterized protein n=1 Tax=Nocardiopsis gilva YIM 90087 TaxID=1235441 RepID=A0A223S4K8_9ACTN|nr:hypothetical protein [Nocardiopsis gilva]ASU83031.1 hypothetical protein CDO52_09750 [Nocardiopsis gilva YIM 90087]